jgi:O-antigen/teichoic acid export membrane protein/glycosyltransferase involved in cell wall biosynthesis
MSTATVTADRNGPFLARCQSLVGPASQGRNALYSLAEYAVVPLLTLAATPYLIHRLGLDVYGIWMLVNSIVGLMCAFDFGLCDAMIRFVALNRGRSHRRGIMFAISTAVVVLVPVSLAASLALYVLAPFFAARLFTIPTEFSEVAVYSMQIGAGVLIVRMAELILASVFRGYERYDITVVASVLVRGLTLCSTVSVAILGFGLPAILTVTIGVSAVGLVVQAILARRLVLSSPKHATSEDESWQTIVSFGVMAWIQTITWMIFSQADRLLIGSLVGTGALAVYSVCLQLAQPVHGLVAAGFSVLFPALSRRIGATDTEGFAQNLWTLMKLNVACSLALVISGWFLAGPLLVLLMGERFAAQAITTLQWLVVACFFQAIQVVPHFILMATGDMLFLTLTSVVGLGATLGVMLVALPSFGLMGAVLGRLTGGVVQCLLFPRIAAFLKRDRRPEPVWETSEPDGAKEETLVATTIHGRSSCWGVSVVVCSHNGVCRLPETLMHLAGQRVPEELPWEVIVVDNASTDGTAVMARQSWPVQQAARLRIVTEPRMGLTHARRRGFGEARYDIVSFVDDDNWVCREWVKLAAEIMKDRPDIGACGGLVEAQCETAPPWWFERFQECYAIGPQSSRTGDVTWSKGYLWGAGLTVRRSAWDELVASGFDFLLLDRCGGDLRSGGDAELCLALRLAGWTLWYDPRLSLRHFISSSRLHWQHVKAVHEGFGVASPAHKAYYAVAENPSRGWRLWLRSRWYCQVAACLIRVAVTRGRMLLSRPCGPGNAAVLEWYSVTGTLRELMRLRSAYDDNFRRVQRLFRQTYASRRPQHQISLREGDRGVLHPHSPFLSELQADRGHKQAAAAWPKISIVIPSFNQGRYLEQTILSILNQQYPNLELIVMDGGSTDDSARIIQKYAAHLTHWQSAPDEGQASAIADGFQMASGDIFAYLNSDDLYLPHALHTVGSLFRKAPETEFLYGDCLMIDEENRIVRRMYPIDFDLDTFLFDHTIIQQQAAFWRHDLYRKTGGIDRAFQFCMDYDLWLRCAQAGASFTRTPSVLAAFRRHPASKTSQLRAIHDQEYSRIFRGAVGRTRGGRDIPKIAYLRLKRYWQEPRGVFEGIKARVQLLRAA